MRTKYANQEICFQSDVVRDYAERGSTESTSSQVRTNERVLYENGNNDGEWRASNWQFRQFELASDNKLTQVPLTNTPINPTNPAFNLEIDNTFYVFWHTTPTYNPVVEQNRFRNWVFQGTITTSQIKQGRHNMPMAFGGAPLLAATADVDGEYAHYWDVDFEASSGNYNVNNYQQNFAVLRDMRHQISLNTCQGCHSGETKTIFTHVLPMGYGDQARYWQSVPDTVQKNIDGRFARNIGENQVFGGTAVKNYPAMPQVQTFNASSFTKHYIPRVSAFLTGRNYAGGVGNSNPYQDDNPWDDVDDQNMSKLFYVFDPSNGSLYNPPFTSPTSHNTHNTVRGYNDLEMRKQLLCQIISTECDPLPGKVKASAVIKLLGGISPMPFPFGSH